MKNNITKTFAYLAQCPGEKFERKEIDLREMTPEKVLIKVSHCGLCYSDYTIWQGVYGDAFFPRAFGHELVGVVEAVGSEVSHIRVGQRVGAGWQGASCGSCEWCEDDHQNVCAAREVTCIHDNGGFSEYKVADAKFVMAIPDAIDSDVAGPLLCAGATVYTPLVRYIKKKGAKIAVVGIGGLGHLALQFANAMGAEVTAISHSADKKEEAFEFGATHFATTDDLESLESSFDLVLVTSSAHEDWDPYFNTVRPFGAMCFLVLDPNSVNINPLQLIRGEKTLCGSAFAPPKVINEMLEFSATNNVRPLIEVMPMSEINDAFQKVSEGKARYRLVLEA